jgi:hypothetical protein
MQTSHCSLSVMIVFPCHVLEQITMQLETHVLRYFGAFFRVLVFKRGSKLKIKV